MIFSRRSSRAGCGWWTTSRRTATGQTTRRTRPSVRTLRAPPRYCVHFTHMGAADFRQQFRDILLRNSPQQRGFYSYLTSVVVSVLLSFSSALSARRSLLAGRMVCSASGILTYRRWGCPERLQGYVLLPSAVFSILPRPFISISIDLGLTYRHRVDRTRRRLRSRLRQVRLFPQHCSPGVSR